ncbi:MAG: hypothetical protein J5546_01025 [Lachnospiraceae bacterium]|nr:hypothetical protein [Lachnospiraceae bacterium]
MRKLMRSIALTVACVLVFGVVAMAANSTSTTTSSATNDQVAKDAYAMNYSLQAPEGTTIYPLNEDWLNSAKDFAKSNGQVGDVLTVFDLQSTAKGFNFSVTYDKLEAGKNYVFLHFVDGQWVIVDAVVNGKMISGYAASTSPWAIAEGTATGAAVVAPKTGEVIAISAILAMLMMAGAVVCAKKARLQK